jgi:hypothetical protein
MMSVAAVHEILDKIQQLSDDERLLLHDRLAALEDAEWRKEAEKARRIAQEKGIDQAAIDQAIQEIRYSS